MGYNLKPVPVADERPLIDQVADLRAPIRNDIIYGRVLTGVDGSNGIVFSAGVAQKINHNLGRPHKGWFVVREFGSNKSEITEDYPSDYPDSLRSTTLYLASAVDATVYLYVF